MGGVGSTRCKTILCIKACFKMANTTEKEKWTFETAPISKVNGDKEKNMGLELTRFQMAPKLWECGLMIISKSEKIIA